MRITPLLSLIRAQLNVNFAISQSRYYYLKKRQRLWEPVLILFGLAALAWGISSGIFKYSCSLYPQFAAIHQAHLLILFGVMTSQALLIVIGFVLVIGVFYYSNDLNLLISLPLRPWEVIAGKFSVVLAGEYIALAVFLGPLLVAFGLKAGVGWISYGLTGILVFLLLPVLPLVIAAILAILLMKLVGGYRRRDTLIVAGTFLLMAAVTISQFFIQPRGGRGQDSAFVARLLAKANSLVDLAGGKFPPSIWITKALGNAGTLSGLLNFVFLLDVSGLGLGALFWIGNRVFYEGVLSGLEPGVVRKRQPPAGAVAVRRALPSWPVWSLAQAEIKIFRRTPVYVLNGFIGFALLPVLLLGAIVHRSAQQAQLWNQFRSAPEMEPLGALLIGACIFILAGFSTIPFTPFSREGTRNIWILQSLPASGMAVAMSKALGAEVMIVLGSLPCVVIIEALLKLSLIYLGAGLLIGIASSAAFCLWGVMVDLVHPMLNWTSQQKAIKSNLNTVASLVVVAVVTYAMKTGIARAFSKGVAGGVVVTGTAAFCLAVLWLSFRSLRAITENAWSRIAD
jgi:ABC-2 type transport system permease protein